MGFRDEFLAIRNSIYSNELIGITVSYNGATVAGAIFKPLTDDGSEVARKAQMDRAELGLLRSAVAAWAYGDVVEVAGRSWKVTRSRLGTDAERLVLELESDVRKVW